MTALHPDFPDLPATARVWLYGSEQRLDTGEIEALKDHMEQFLIEWRSHGRPITPRWQLVHDRFVMIGVDESEAVLSGCSMDSMVHALSEFGRRSGVAFSNSGNQVFYRDDAGEIHCADRLAFIDLAGAGRVNDETIVFDNTIDRLDQVRSGRWEVPLNEAWHMQVFGRWLVAAPSERSPVSGVGQARRH